MTLRTKEALRLLVFVPISIAAERLGMGEGVENINLSGARLLGAQSHHYLASWSGPRSRATLPKLERRR